MLVFRWVLMDCMSTWEGSCCLSSYCSSRIVMYALCICLAKQPVLQVPGISGTHDKSTQCAVAEAEHTFSPNATDWGFTVFMHADEVLDERLGYLRNDTIILKVEIIVQPDERFSYDSKAETGCVGLKNQGATCYMNSLLQYLFHLCYFRKVCT
jgi:Ubiquitin carboxyl-terminal hydrolase